METKVSTLHKASHLIAWRGVCFILFGILAFFWAGPALWALIWAFGLFALVDGIILMVMYEKHRHVWGKAALWFGVISAFIGLYALLFPSLTALALAVFIAVRALFGGILELKMAAGLKKHASKEALLIVNGILSILFACVMMTILFTQPVIALLVLVEVIGLYAFCIGVVLLLLSSHIKDFKKEAAMLTGENTIQ